LIHFGGGDTLNIWGLEVCIAGAGRLGLGEVMKARYIVIPGILLSSMMACSGSEVQPLNLFDSPANVHETVVYGSDDRMDLYQIADPAWQERAASTVALVSGSKVQANTDGSGYTLKTMPYGKSMGLCQREPFYDQVSAAFCSGTLVAPDVILTAGHCIRTQIACNSAKFLFNFSYKALGDNPVTFANDDVYSCKELIHSVSVDPGNLDFALVRLDRPVVGRQPLAMRTQGRISDRDPLVVIGYPKGLPVKMAAGANVRSNKHRNFFVANLDTYAGNSGSAVFNENTGEIEGVLVRGEQDFVFTDAGCYVSNVCDDGGCRGEDVTRVQWALPFLNN
jgi:V8-like Glu-specific endopeptidase